MPDATLPARRRTKAPRRRPLARTALALLLLAMAAGQLSDVDGFAGILGNYRVLPDGLLVPVAWALAGAEAMAGGMLLQGRRCGATLALAVALAWTALGAQAFARGLALENCGCFGVHLGQRLRWWVLLEDAEFVALAGWVRRGEARRAWRRRADRAVSCRPLPPALAGSAPQSGA